MGRRILLAVLITASIILGCSALRVAQPESEQPLPGAVRQNPVDLLLVQTLRWSGYRKGQDKAKHSGPCKDAVHDPQNGPRQEKHLAVWLLWLQYFLRAVRSQEEALATFLEADKPEEVRAYEDRLARTRDTVPVSPVV